MRITNEILEQYLDLELTKQQRMDIDRLLKTDTALKARMAAIGSHRALRQAAMASYQPDAGYAADFATATLQMARARSTAPLARIGPVARRAGLIAASLTIAVSAFVAGRFSAPAGAASMARRPALAKVLATTAKPAVPYVVRIEQPNGQAEQRSFTSYQAARRYAASYVDQQNWVSDTAMVNATPAPQGQF